MEYETKNFFLQWMQIERKLFWQNCAYNVEYWIRNIRIFLCFQDFVGIVVGKNFVLIPFLISFFDSIFKKKIYFILCFDFGCFDFGYFSDMQSCRLDGLRCGFFSSWGEAVTLSWLFVWSLCAGERPSSSPLCLAIGFILDLGERLRFPAKINTARFEIPSSSCWKGRQCATAFLALRTSLLPIGAENNSAHAVTAILTVKRGGGGWGRREEEKRWSRTREG